jgi:hypothetical protein
MKKEYGEAEDAREEGKTEKGKKKEGGRGRRKKMALQPVLCIGLVEMFMFNSHQGELINKYLWVGADICKHS